MTEYTQSQQVSFRWWRNDRRAIPETHLEDLQEHAQARIREMTLAAYTSGQLVISVYDHRTGENTDYAGYWEVKELTD